MGTTALQPEQKWTYADYCSWPDDERWELIDGVAYSMSPAPTRRHQDLSGALFNQLYTYLKGTPCKVYAAAFDVRLSDYPEQPDDEVETVVQPDIVVVCDPSKLDDKGCKGAPDLVVEILSPSTGGKDLTVKYDLYERHGVKEYWIIHPAEQTLLVYKLSDDKKYGSADRYANSSKVMIPLLGGLEIDLAEVFAE